MFLVVRVLASRCWRIPSSPGSELGRRWPPRHPRRDVATRGQNVSLDQVRSAHFRRREVGAGPAGPRRPRIAKDLKPPRRAHRLAPRWTRFPQWGDRDDLTLGWSCQCLHPISKPETFRTAVRSERKAPLGQRPRVKCRFQKPLGWIGLGMEGLARTKIRTPRPVLPRNWFLKNEDTVTNKGRTIMVQNAKTVGALMHYSDRADGSETIPTGSVGLAKRRREAPGHEEALHAISRAKINSPWVKSCPAFFDWEGHTKRLTFTVVSCCAFGGTQLLPSRWPCSRFGRVPDTPERDRG